MKWATVAHLGMFAAGVLGWVGAMALGYSSPEVDMIFSGLISASGYGAFLHSLPGALPGPKA